MADTYDAFIAYSRRNRKFVDRLSADLKQHAVAVWMDTTCLEVGDPFRRKIEEAIESSRYFCLVVSPASMRSFYVRRLELETAFTRMVRARRDGFILPLLWRYPAEDLPAMLATFHYLDFSRPAHYMNNLQRLAKRIKLDDEHFTGARWYKGIDVSPAGILAGVGPPLSQLAIQGACVRLFFEDGRIRSMETYTDGKPDGSKSVGYDAQGRVSEIILFRNNFVVDTWRYEYDPKTGLRKHKYVVPPGGKPHRRFTYDSTGKRIGESVLPERKAPVGQRRRRKGMRP